MIDPIHPGLILKHDCIEALGLTVTEAAQALGVSRTTLSRLTNARAGMSPEMAIRVSKRFGSRPEMWLKLQLAFDLSRAERQFGTIELPPFVSGDTGGFNQRV